MTNFHQFQPISYYDISRGTFAPNPSVCSYLTSHARHPDLTCLIHVRAEVLAFTGLESGEFSKMSCLRCVCSIPDELFLMNQSLKALASCWHWASQKSYGYQELSHHSGISQNSFVLHLGFWALFFYIFSTGRSS